MSRSAFTELYNRMFKQGSGLNLFLGINILVFLITGLIRVAGFLVYRQTLLADAISNNLAMPSYPPELMEKFWTPLTYMFGHEGFLHILFNMLWLYWMGRILEEFIDRRHFLYLYLGGGFAGALAFLLAFNFIPALKDTAGPETALIGASASVMAIVAGVATLLPDYPLMLLLIGQVRLKYFALIFIALDILLLLNNPGGSFAHLGGALFGYVYIRQLKKGRDWSMIFSRKPRLKVVSKGGSAAGAVPDQETIDRLLDKISRSGYDSLSKAEKEQLFRASKHDETKK
jgi:membrane associated rhomboid family serine protease